jgi:hypothetical protein
LHDPESDERLEGGEGYSGGGEGDLEATLDSGDDGSDERGDELVVGSILFCSEKEGRVVNGSDTPPTYIMAVREASKGLLVKRLVQSFPEVVVVVVVKSGRRMPR